MPFYFRVPLPGPFGYSKRIGGTKRRRPAPAPRAQQPRITSRKLRAQDLRRMTPEQLAHAIADTPGLSPDDRQWMREVYGEPPAGCGWRWAAGEDAGLGPDGEDLGLRLVMTPDNPGRLSL